MKVDRDYLAKLLNSLNSAMFATIKEADIPQEVLDGIMRNDPNALEGAVAYLKAIEIPDKERTLRANIIVWGINTIALTGELGMVNVKNETDVGQLPPISKESPK
jgi:hypothetical protein